MALRTRTERLYRTYLALLGAAAAVAVVGAVFAAWAAGSSTAATTVAPTNTVEPRISGTTRVGQVLRTTRGQWTGTGPIQYSYRWFRCKGPGASDASDCTRVSNAGDNTYTLREADAGFQMRSQVVATNADGSTKATSNPTGVVTSRASDEHEGAVDHGNRDRGQHAAGEPRRVGRRAADHLLVHLAAL